MVLVKTLESLLEFNEIKPVNLKGNQSWIFIGRTGWSWNSNTLATWYEELTHLKRSRCRKRLKAGVEGDDREWNCWMASLTQWTWVWASSRSWWWTGMPGVLQSTGLQRVRHNWATELIHLLYQHLKKVLAENVEAWRFILTLSLTSCDLGQVNSSFLVLSWQERWRLDWTLQQTTKLFLKSDTYFPVAWKPWPFTLDLSNNNSLVLICLLCIIVLTNFSWKIPDSKYFQLFRLQSLCVILTQFYHCRVKVAIKIH